MSKAVLQPFEDYQKARITFVQHIAELATRPQNIEALHSAGVMSLLRPLLIDNVSSIAQSSALAIGRLASFSEELAESVINNDIITELIQSISTQGRFFKKAACLVLKSVAKHSPKLAKDIVTHGGLEPLVRFLEEFDPSVKENAAWAIGFIAKHSPTLSHLVVEARAVDSLILCLQEPELSLKRAAAQTLSYICQHTEQLAQPVAESGLDTITLYLNTNDIQLKRNLCLLLGNITKHSIELADMIMNKLNPQRLLACLKEDDLLVKKNAAYCICEIVKKSPNNASVIVNNGGTAILVDYIRNVKGDARLYGIMSLGYIAGFKEELAMSVIQCNAIEPLKDALINEESQYIKAATCYTFGHIGRHSNVHSKEVSKAKILEDMLYYYINPESIDDLKSHAKHALNKIIDISNDIPNLETILQVAPERIIKHILVQFNKFLSVDKDARVNFASTGGLYKLQELKQKIQSELILEKIEKINSYFPEEAVKYYSPGYANDLLEKIEV